VDVKTPASLGFAMPAEWEPHERTFMAWPCRKELWRDAVRMQRARAVHAQLAKAINEVEPLVMIARPEDASEAERQCGKNIEVRAIPIDDSWVRDSGPVFVRRGAEIAGVDWRFNAWGNKYTGYEDDDKLPERLLSELGIRRFAAPIVLEGGSVAVDGAGTLMTTEECLLNPNRNPGVSRADIEKVLTDYCGVRRIMWLPYGLEDDETDGHIDNVAAFAAPKVVLLNWSDDESDPNFLRMRANEEALKAAQDRAGQNVEIVRVQEPPRALGWNGRRLPLSYLNFYVANEAVFAPAFDSPLDHEAAAILRDCFPSRKVVQLPMLDVVAGGGGIHCITQQQPLSGKAR
ncbi:MAG TPA: agmatine deiminase family protein, partial [Alphaproteobacteria bacterium]|nr:agmatine deiminase family protein [Alphaproteobacteria bacterium]